MRPMHIVVVAPNGLFDKTATGILAAHLGAVHLDAAAAAADVATSVSPDAARDCLHATHAPAAAAANRAAVRAAKTAASVGVTTVITPADSPTCFDWGHLQSTGDVVAVTLETSETPTTLVERLHATASRRNLTVTPPPGIPMVDMQSLMGS